MHLVFPKGFSVNFVLLTWALFGGLFIYAFLANFRTMLLMPQYGKPIDSAEEVMERGMIPFVYGGVDYYKHVLLHSSIPVYHKLGEIVVGTKDYDEYLKKMNEDILGANTHVYLGYLDDYDRSLGKFHESKDVLEGSDPSVVDILNKKWSLAEEYSYHLLVIQQVKNYF